jgi:hypothetical protein
MGGQKKERAPPRKRACAEQGQPDGGWSPWKGLWIVVVNASGIERTETSYLTKPTVEHSERPTYLIHQD